jgi:ParB-like nuclease family protein
MKDRKYEAHPLANLFPAVEGKAFTDLVADIKEHGLVNPIVRQGNVLLDGRNRLRACKQARVSPRFVEFSSLGLKITPEEFIWSTNVERRHLSDDQRAIVAHEWAEALAKEARVRQLAALKHGNKVLQMKRAGEPPAKPNATRRAIAQRAQVSMHKVQQVEAVKKHAPDLVQKVASGKMKLKDAAKVAAKKMPRRKLHLAHRPIVNPLTPHKAAARVMDNVIADVKNVLHRVVDQQAFFSTLSDQFEVWCKRMQRKSKAA